jgi:hypothetical protein
MAAIEAVRVDTAQKASRDEKKDLHSSTNGAIQQFGLVQTLSPATPRWQFWRRSGDATTDAVADDSAVDHADLTPLPEEAKKQGLARAWQVVWKFLCFMGPGALISVAYIDPDNYQTQIQSGQDFEYKLLFMILVSNVIAIYLQVRDLCVLVLPSTIDIGQSSLG